MLPLPIKFDGNEWFIILNILLGSAWVLFCPKRYPTAISVLIVFFGMSLAIILDHSLATPPLDLYDINDQKKYELMDVVTYFMYSPYALLSVYLYDKLNPRGLYFTAYVIGWALLSVGFEWLAVKFHVFTYNHWSLFYSFSVYLITTTLHFQFFRLILKYFHEKKQPAPPS